MKFGVPRPVTCKKKTHVKKLSEARILAGILTGSHPSLVGKPMEVKRKYEQIHNGVRQANKFTVSSTAGIWSRNNIRQSRRGARVEKWIDETKWFAFVFRQAEIIQQSEKWCDSLFFCGLSVYRNPQKEKRGLTGQLALVPFDDSIWPPKTTWKLMPWAEISGYARPAGLMKWWH